MTPELAVKTALAAAVGLAVAEALHLPFPEYTVLAAATVTDVRLRQSGQLGLLRMVGTIVGVGLSILLVRLTGVTPWTVGLASLVGMSVCVLARSAPAARLSVIVIGVGTLGFSDRVEDWGGGRLLTTAVGAVITIAVSALPWPARATAALEARTQHLPWVTGARRLFRGAHHQHRLTKAGIVSEE